MPDLGAFYFLPGMNEAKAAIAHPADICTWPSQGSDLLSPSTQMNSAARPLRASPGIPADLLKEPEGSDSDPPGILMIEKRGNRGGGTHLLLPCERGSEVGFLPFAGQPAKQLLLILISPCASSFQWGEQTPGAAATR